MVIKFMESTYDAFKDRLKNPFFGTLLLVWILRNREFLFNLFFNEKYNSEKTLNLLKTHFEGSQAVISLLTTIAFSLLLLALFYGSLNLSRFILEFSETTVKPKVSKLFSSNNIVTKEEYTRVESERDYYQKKYTEEKNEKIRIQRELDQSSIIDDKIIDGGEIKEDQTGLHRVAKSIKEEGIAEEFSTLIGLTNSDYSADGIIKIIDPESINKFLQKNLIKRIYTRNDYYYEFTNFGEKTRDYYLNNFS